MVDNTCSVTLYVENACDILWASERIELKKTWCVLDSSTRFDKRLVVAGLKCQPEEFGFDPRVKRQSVSSSSHWEIGCCLQAHDIHCSVY